MNADNPTSAARRVLTRSDASLDKLHHAGLSGLLACFLAATGAATGQVAAPAPPVGFDVASVRQLPPGVQRLPHKINFAHGRLTAVAVPVEDLVRYAYGMCPSSPACRMPFEEVDGPKWIHDGPLFTIEATTDPDSTVALAQEMLLELLKQRFRLVAHSATKFGTYYALTVAPGGSKMLRRDASSGHLKIPPCPGGPCDVVTLSITMDELAGALSRRPDLGLVLNRTGLAGLFAFGLRVSADEPGSPVGPDITEALREQLGLQLQKRKGLVPYLVVDHAERPTPN